MSHSDAEMARALNEQPGPDDHLAHDDHKIPYHTPAEEPGELEWVVKIPKWQKITLWIGVFLTAYVNGLDNFTMSVYLNQAAAKFGATVQYTTLATVQSMILAVGKPFYAKLSDVFGRPACWIISVTSFVIGLIIIACAQGINTLAAGCVFFALGNCGVSFAENLILADLVVPRWRGFVSNLMTYHFIINFGVSGKITGALIPDHWRWGVGMFCIFYPVVTAPIIYVLVVQQRELARHLGRPNRPYPGLNLAQAAWAFLVDFDIIGLLCMAGGFCLLLLPLTIADRAPHGWHTGYIIAMFVLGGLLLIAWPFVEMRVSRPLVRFKYLFTNIDVITAAAVYFLDQFSYGMTLSSQYQWCQIVFGYSVSGATYFTYTQSLTLVIFGCIAGGIAIYTRRYKWMIVFGAGFRLMGVGLMIRYREADSSTFQVVIPQVIQGIGGGFMTANLFVAAQAAVPHVDTAGVTGFMYLTLSLGSAIGSAVTGAVQQGLLGLLHKAIDPIAGDTTTALTIYEYGSTIMAKFPLGTPIRTATISAWNEVMHRLLVGSIILAAINFLVSFLVPDRRLAENSQNNVKQEPTVPLPPLSLARELDQD